MHKIADNRRLLTVAETANRLGVSVHTVRRHIGSGRLPAVQLGSRGSAVRVDEGDLDAFVYGLPETHQGEHSAPEAT